MKIKTLLVASVVCSSFASVSHAEDFSDVPVCFEAWKTGNAEIGHVCRTEGRNDDFDVYQRVERKGFGKAWKDLRTGLIWSEKRTFKDDDGSTTSRAFFDDAWDACAALGAKLPQSDDFQMTDAGGLYNPMHWKDAYYYYTSDLDILSPLAPFIVRTASGRGFFKLKHRSTPGQFVKGGNDRRYRSDASTVCIDDFQELVPVVRPQKPAPVEHIRF